MLKGVRWSRWQGVVVTSIGWSAATACSLFTDFGTLREDQPNASDGATSSPDGASSDSGASNVDGGADADAGSGRFCGARSGFILCEDFEDESLSESWVRRVDPPTSSKVDVISDPSNPSNHVVYAQPSGPMSSVRHAFFQRGFTQPAPSRSRFSYSFKIDPASPASSEFEVNILRFKTPAGMGDFYLLVSRGEVLLKEQGYFDDGGGGGGATLVPGVPVRTNTWIRISIETDVQARKVTFSINNEPPITVDQTRVIAVGVPQIIAGINYVADGDQPGSVYVDDLLFEALP